MKKILSLFVFLSGAYAASAQCTGCNTNVTTNSSVNYVVNAGQKLCVASNGTITGLIVVNGGTLCNQGNITTSKVSVSNGGYFVNYGTTKIDSLLIQNSASKHDNYGTETFVRFSTITGATSNNATSITADYIGDSSGVLINNGYITINHDLYNSYNGAFYNNNFLRINGSFYNSSNAMFYTACKISVAQNWYNSATVEGPTTNCGGFNIAGYSANSGTVGLSGQKIDICDAGSPTAFDANSGNVSNTTFCACTNTCVGLAGVKENTLNEISQAIYPNPCTQKCSTEYKEAISSAQVLNSLGQLVKVDVKISGTKVEITTTGLSRGIYFLETISSGGKAGRQKMLVE